MPEASAAPVNVLLLEPETLLRRTVSLTARSLGIARVHEAATQALALRLIKAHAFHGAVIAIDPQPGAAGLLPLDLVDELRRGDSASKPSIPIAVMVEKCDASLLMALRERGISRIILKPFRARILLDTFAEFGAAQGAQQPPAH